MGERERERDFYGSGEMSVLTYAYRYPVSCGMEGEASAVARVN